MHQSALFDVASACPTHTAVIDSAGSYTYQQLAEHSGRVSAELLGSEGDLHEQRIAFLIKPGFNYVAAQWGIWRSGGVAVPLGAKHPPPELAYVIDDAEVSTLIVPPELLDRVADIAAYRSIRLITTDQFESVSPRIALPRLDQSRRAMILYTSGSTGQPKGVVTTHGNIQSQIDTLVEAWQWQPSDHILHVLPLHHIHGIINALGCAMRVGAVCEFQPFAAEQVWQRFARGDLTLFMAVPTIYAKLISAWERAPPDRQDAWAQGARQMRLMVSGSAALPVSTLQTWERITGQRLLERYGMTEIGMALSNPLHGNRRAGHVGRPLADVEVRRTGDAGQLVEGEMPGEIEVRGPNVFLEYWKQPSATRDSFRDGWFRTGDVALVDDGDYRILGRSSVDMIKTGGYKVSALEIEDVLRNHPQIRDCAVVGVPDEEWGERVAVCVVCRDRGGVELDALRAWTKTRLAVYKVPTLLRVVDELPCNPMGKVQKPSLRKLFQT